MLNKNIMQEIRLIPKMRNENGVKQYVAAKFLSYIRKFIKSNKSIKSKRTETLEREKKIINNETQKITDMNENIYETLKIIQPNELINKLTGEFYNTAETDLTYMFLNSVLNIPHLKGENEALEANLRQLFFVKPQSNSGSYGSVSPFIILEYGNELGKPNVRTTSIENRLLSRRPKEFSSAKPKSILEDKKTLAIKTIQKSVVVDSRWAFHEYFIGIKVVNEMRKYIPNFAMVFAYFDCGSVKIFNLRNRRIRDDIAVCCYTPLTSLQFGNSNLENIAVIQPKRQTIGSDFSSVIYEGVYPNISLYHFLSQNDFDAKEWFMYFMQILLAIEAINKENDFTHYDLSLANVMLRELVDSQFKGRTGNQLTEGRMRYERMGEYIDLISTRVATIIDYGFAYLKTKDMNEAVSAIGYEGIDIGETNNPIKDCSDILINSWITRKSGSRNEEFDKILDEIFPIVFGTSRLVMDEIYDDEMSKLSDKSGLNQKLLASALSSLSFANDKYRKISPEESKAKLTKVIDSLIAFMKKSPLFKCDYTVEENVKLLSCRYSNDIQSSCKSIEDLVSNDKHFVNIDFVYRILQIYSGGKSQNLNKVLNEIKKKRYNGLSLSQWLSKDFLSKADSIDMDFIINKINSWKIPTELKTMHNFDTFRSEIMQYYGFLVDLTLTFLKWNSDKKALRFITDFDQSLVNIEEIQEKLHKLQTFSKYKIDEFGDLLQLTNEKLLKLVIDKNNFDKDKVNDLKDLILNCRVVIRNIPQINF